MSDLKKAAELATEWLGEYIGDAVAAVLRDHENDEHPDPNVHELAHRMIYMAEETADFVKAGIES